MSFKTRSWWVYVICLESPSFPCPQWPHFSIFKKLTCTYVVSHRTLISDSVTRNSAVSLTRPASWTFSPQDEGWLWSSSTGVYSRHERGKWGGNINVQFQKYKIPDRPSLPSRARNTLWVRKQIVVFPLVYLRRTLIRTGIRIQFNVNHFTLDSVQLPLHKLDFTPHSIHFCLPSSESTPFGAVYLNQIRIDSFQFCQLDSAQHIIWLKNIWWKTDSEQNWFGPQSACLSYI